MRGVILGAASVIDSVKRKYQWESSNSIIQSNAGLNPVPLALASDSNCQIASIDSGKLTMMLDMRILYGYSSKAAGSSRQIFSPHIKLRQKSIGAVVPRINKF